MAGVKRHLSFFQVVLVAGHGGAGGGREVVGQEVVGQQGLEDGVHLRIAATQQTTYNTLTKIHHTPRSGGAAFIVL